ncbi:MAG: hypothetical protein AAF546_00095 [Verrucomicrobiota bacterium]
MIVHLLVIATFGILGLTIAFICAYAMAEQKRLDELQGVVRPKRRKGLKSFLRKSLKALCPSTRADKRQSELQRNLKRSGYLNSR